jgi:ankyrin repeat protein
MQGGTALIAYYYFDFKDAAKRDVRGLLSSLLFQLADCSDSCWGILSQLHKVHGDGSRQPSNAELSRCLKNMLEIPGQVPIVVIADALDECPSDTGTPSAREKVLNLVEDLVRSNYVNLYMCITSRPEQDIRAILNPLKLECRRVSLHKEAGQREDINSYIRSFVHTDGAMRRWKREDKELVISTLSERANGMYGTSVTVSRLFLLRVSDRFRWVFCQLDTLRRCFPPSIRETLNKLPTTLDATYERALQGIPKEKMQHAHRLFQCLVAAIRPLRVEELAEILAIEFNDWNTVPNLVEGWRPEDPEEAVLSACSTLITIIDKEGSKVVQFSHFSVKEFLTSDRLLITDVESIRRYHISLDAAHTILARACITVLLHLDESMNKKRLRTFPLAFYAAQHWVDHAKFGDVTSRIQDTMERLFNPSEPYLASWVWIHDVDGGQIRESTGSLAKYPTVPKATALYYAALCGFSTLVNHLIVTHTEDVNAKCGNHGTPLHAASYEGHLDATRLLLDHGADVNVTDELKRTPLCSAHSGGHLEVMRLLLGRGADVNARYNPWGLLSHDASSHGQAEVLHLLLQHNADVNARGSVKWTPLHWASKKGHAKVVRLLLEYGADVNAPSKVRNTPLLLASAHGRLEVVRILLEHGADVHTRGQFNWTAFQMATLRGYGEVAKLLLEHGSGKE